MNPYLKSALIVLASALAQVGVTATPIVALRIPTTLDLWVIGLAVIVNIASTSLALLLQSPLPRKEWTDEERAAKVVSAAVVPPVVKPA